MVASAPWLTFWKGVCQQFVDPFTARVSLEQAYAGFSRENDVIGQALTASAIIDIIYFSRQNFLLTIHWVEELQKKFLVEDLTFPQPTIEAKILTSLVSVLMFVRPQDPQLPQCVDRLLMLHDNDLDINQKVWSAGHARPSERICAHV